LEQVLNPKEKKNRSTSK